MNLPDNISKLLHPSIHDMSSWSTLLFFFSDHKHLLSRQQRRDLYFQCETIRSYWNTEYVEDITIWRPGTGEEMIVPRRRVALNIRQEDIFPNDIYQDQTILDNLSYQIS